MVAIMHAEAGKKCKGKVVGITGFGAFVRLEDGTNGLIHISQVSTAYVSDVRDFLSVGQEVEPTVLSVDEKGRIALTLRPSRRTQEGPSPGTQPMLFPKSPAPDGFENMMEHFRSVSDEKMGDLRRSRGGKRAHHRK